MISIGEYHDGDWSRIEDAMEPFTPMYDGQFDEIARHGIAVTAVDDNKAMAVGGVTFVNEKEGMVWVKISKKCLKRPVMWARAIKETFGIMANTAGVRIYTYILNDFCKGEKLARLIGMKRTGEKMAHNGNIYNRYVVVV